MCALLLGLALLASLAGGIVIARAAEEPPAEHWRFRVPRRQTPGHLRGLLRKFRVRLGGIVDGHHHVCFGICLICHEFVRVTGHRVGLLFLYFLFRRGCYDIVRLLG